MPDRNVPGEDCLDAIGKNVGYGNINSALRMNKAIVGKISKPNSSGRPLDRRDLFFLHYLLQSSFPVNSYFQ